LLDWQISRYASPVLDLAYFFFINTDHQMRLKHYDELLNIYHRSLKELLDHMGGDTSSQFPFTALLRQLKTFGKWGFIMSAFIVPMITTKKEDLPDMDFMAANMKNEDQSLMKQMMENFNRDDTYSVRMRGNLLDLLKYGYL